MKKRLKILVPALTIVLLIGIITVVNKPNSTDDKSNKSVSIASPEAEASNIKPQDTDTTPVQPVSEEQTKKTVPPTPSSQSAAPVASQTVETKETLLAKYPEWTEADKRCLDLIEKGSPQYFSTIAERANTYAYVKKVYFSPCTSYGLYERSAKHWETVKKNNGY